MDDKLKNNICRFFRHNRDLHKITTGMLSLKHPVRIYGPVCAEGIWGSCTVSRLF